MIRWLIPLVLFAFPAFAESPVCITTEPDDISSLPRESCVLQWEDITCEKISTYSGDWVTFRLVKGLGKQVGSSPVRHPEKPWVVGALIVFEMKNNYWASYISFGALDEICFAGLSRPLIQVDS